jgi:hypothetical protein
MAEISASIAAGLSPAVAANTLRQMRASIEEVAGDRCRWKPRVEDADAKAAALRPSHGLSNRAALTRAAMRQAPGREIDSANARVTKQATWPMSFR